MRIVHLSDFHLTANPDERIHGINPYKNLETAVAIIGTHNPRPHLIVLGGDIFENSYQADYGFVFDLFATLQIPCHAVVGNHDDLDNLVTAFHFGKKDGFPGYYSFNTNSVHVVILNSSEAGKGYGQLDQEQLQWLAADLERSGSNKSLIFMHHPAFETGIVWLDKLRLVDEDIFWGILNPYTPNILGLFTAHLHRQFICSFKDVLSVGCPSVSWQFSGNADASKGEVSDEPPGFNLIDISEEGIRTQTIRFSVNN